MGPGRVVVFDEGGQDAAEVGFVENQELIQTFFAHSAYPTFGESIGVGCLEGSRNDADTLGPENSVVSVGELFVVVVDQETRFDVTFLEAALIAQPPSPATL